MIDELKHVLSTKLGSDIIKSESEVSTPFCIEVEPGKLIAVCSELKNNDKLYFDLLSCITGLDNGPEAGTMEVIYNLYSIPFEHALMMKVVLDRKKPEVSSVHEFWKTALWHEREAFDLLGITFTDHPDLRRILLPADWEGHPLRKDYEHQEYYRSIKVEY